MSAEMITGVGFKPSQAGLSHAARAQRSTPAPHSYRFSPGERVGTFEVLGALGHGGTAEVYRAVHPSLGEVALKISTNGFENYLRQEAFTLRKLANSRNTAKLLSYGLEEGWHCMAMEIITGRTVLALLKDGPVALPKALDIITQVCYGLNNFHEQGLAHLDVKPNNLLIDESGKVTLIDAGSATPVPTQPNDKVKVTLSFCSPEQYGGEPVDQRSDIFNLGLIFYSMLTGHHPFTGRQEEKAQQIRFSEVPMLPDSFHPQIRAIVGRMTAHDRANRYQNVMDIVRDIRLFTENQ